MKAGFYRIRILRSDASRGKDDIDYLIGRIVTARVSSKGEASFDDHVQGGLVTLTKGEFEILK